MGKSGMLMVGPSNVIDRNQQQTSNPWVALAVLTLIYTFNFADRFLITGLVGPIKEEFSVGDGTIGVLMGPAFVVLYVLLGVPFARMADRGSRLKIIGIGCLLWSVATISTGMASGMISLSLSRVAVGIGEAAFVAPAYSLLADYFKPERRSLAFAILGLATYFGQIAGQAGGPAVAELTKDWRNAFFIMGAPGVLLGLLALFWLPEPPRESSPAERAAGDVPFAELVRLLARTSTFVLLLAGFSLSALSGIAFGYWGPELLARVHHLDPVTVKSAFALNFGLSGLAGMLAFGFVSDRQSRRGMEWPARLSAIAISAATLAILAVVWSDSFGLAMALAIPAGVLGGGWTVGMMATLQYVLPARFRASGTALFYAVATLGGYLVAPWVTGLLSEVLGDDGRSLQLALTIVIPFGFVGALFTIIASRRVEAGRERLACS